jgi:HEAT repeat protein
MWKMSTTRICALAIVILSGVAGCDRNEPRAGGASLSHWKHEAQQVSFFSFWNSTKDERRAEAFRRLKEIGEPAVPVLVELMHHKNLSVSGDAINALAQLGPRAKSAVPNLVRVVNGNDKQLRIFAILILERIGPDAAAAIPSLTAALRDKNASVARVAASALAAIGGAGHIALAHAATDPNASVRQASVSGLAAAPRDPASTRAQLEKALDDPSPNVRATAIQTLFLGGAAQLEPSIDLLVRAMRDSSEIVRQAAAQAFTTAKQQSGITPRMLAAVMASGDPGSRADAAWALSLAMHNLVDQATMSAADSADLTRALLGALDDPDARVRIYAARGLVSNAAARDRVVTLLRSEIPKVDAEMKIRAATPLWEMTHRIEDVQAALEAGLAAQNQWTRREALREILVTIGPPAAPLIPAIEKLRDDPDREIRGLADLTITALRKR